MSTLAQFAGSGIKSVQRGTITINAGAASNTATVTAVDTAKSVLSLLGWTASANVSTSGPGRLALTNATTITATRSGSPADTAVYSYELVEYY